MANNQTLKNQISNRGNNAPAQAQHTLKSIMSSEAVKKRFEEILNKRAPQFMTSLINLYNQEKALQSCDPMSIISSAMVAATLDLPVDKNLGYAWIVPYAGKGSFQLGYKGYVQLALRSGQYKYINALPIHEGELVSWNPLTEELKTDFTEKKSDVVVGYAAYFELINGFRKTVYWTKAEIENHRKKFSKSDFGWKRDWDAMATKTVLRNMLSKWGILSIDMQTAEIADEREIKDISPEGVVDVIDLDFTESNEDDQTEGESNGEQ